MAAQAGGVGIIMLGMAGAVLVDDAGDEEQAERKKVKRPALPKRHRDNVSTVDTCTRRTPVLAYGAICQANRECR